MGKILVEGIRLFAYHGCMEEESRIGGNYSVDVSIDADLEKPAETDKLKDTIDYVQVYETVKEEMAVRSKLIEHVAARICANLKKKFTGIKKVEVKVSKLNPPLGGAAEKVSVILSE